QIIETGPPTEAVTLGRFDVMDDAARERGFVVISYWRGTGSSVAFIIDPDGEIVWWHESEISGIARARMSADGKNMWLIPASNLGGPLERVSMDTLDAQVYPDTAGSHDLTPVSGEVMAFIDYGESDCDSIFEIDPSGNVVEIWESTGVVSAPGCHGNALRYSQKEDVYTFSDVAQDVVAVSRQGELKWRLTEIVDGGIDAWGGRNHGHQLLDDSILIFANDGAGPNSSTIVEYTLTGETIFEYEGGRHTANLGDVQRLPGGNTLITYSNASVVREIDANKNVVLEFGGGASIGYTLWRPTLYGPPPDIAQ